MWPRVWPPWSRVQAPRGGWQVLPLLSVAQYWSGVRVDHVLSIYLVHVGVVPGFRVL